MRIPDLRHNDEITLEHCSVLLEKLGQTLDIMDGQKNNFETHLLNPQFLLNHYDDTFEPDAFTRLFASELGKGVLIGSYVQYLQDKQALEEAEED